METSNPTSHQQYVQLTRRQRKEALVQEFDNKCILCGKTQGENPVWAVVNIINRETTKDVSFRGKALICSPCAGRKQSWGIGEYASSLSPEERVRFILRVLRLRFKGRITTYKTGLLLAEFLPFHLSIKDKSAPEFIDKYDILMYETNGCCIYCGNPLSPPGVTYDHILPKSLGGKAHPQNLVIACNACNNLRGTRPIDEFVSTFTQVRFRHYTKRVKELAR